MTRTISKVDTKTGEESYSHEYFGNLGKRLGLEAEQVMFIKNLFSSLRLTRKEAIKYLAAKISYPAARRRHPKEFLIGILDFLVDVKTSDLILILRNPKLDLELEQHLFKVVTAICEDEDRKNHIHGYTSQIVRILRGEILELNNA